MAMTVVKALNQGLHEAMSRHRDVVLIGEDLLDPYGGAFKVARGLSRAFPDQVLTTPISEAGFMGVAIGMAMRGMLPVVEIMFGDFLLLAADQLINHGAKFRWMYNEKVDVPLLVRAPMGGRRGYGPTHSQCLEKHFFGVPGLAVAAVQPIDDPGAQLKGWILKERRPLLVVESKTMYARPVRTIEEGYVDGFRVEKTGGLYPTYTLSAGHFERADLTLLAYGSMVELALETAETLLIEEETYVDVVVPTGLHPFDSAPLMASLARSGRLLVCEEASLAAGFGAETVARVAEEGFSLLQAAPLRVGARAIPLGNAPALEEAILPSVDELLAAARRLVGPRGLRQTGS